MTATAAPVHLKPSDALPEIISPSILAKFEEDKKGLKLKGTLIGLSKATLHKVIEEAQRLSTDTVVRTTGVISCIDSDLFIFKIEEDKKTLKFHIIRYSKWEELGRGSLSIVKKVLLISEARFVPFKTMLVDSGEAENSDSFLTKFEGITTEYEMGHAINEQGEHPGLQGMPITWINIRRPNKRPIIGIVGKEIYPKDMSIWVLEKRLAKKTFNPKYHVYVCKLLMEAVSEIWSRGFSHGELKLHNVFIDFAGFLKIGDFETVRRHKEVNKVKQYALRKFTSRYIALYDHLFLNADKKESNEKEFIESCKALDVFATGIIMFNILALDYPYQLDSSKSYCEGPLIEPDILKIHYSPAVINLVKSMINLLPTARIKLESSAERWKDMK